MLAYVGNRVLVKGRIVAIAVLCLLVLNACSNEEDSRWYSAEQVIHGNKVFQQNCAMCHGVNAEATPDWKQTDANGNFPPPPLNGTAHAWHHGLDVLREQIREGGAPVGGVMPPFKQVLNAEEIDQAIAYFQSKWSDELYEKWANHFEVNQLPSIGTD